MATKREKKVQRDEHGVFILAFGHVYRPEPSKSVGDILTLHSVLREGDRVTVKPKAENLLATIKGRGLIAEIWHSHGQMNGKSQDIWTPVEETDVMIRRRNELAASHSRSFRTDSLETGKRRRRFATRPEGL